MAPDQMTFDDLERLFRADFETGQLYRLTNTRGARAGDLVFQHKGTSGYMRFLIGKNRRKGVAVHRVIWALANGRWPDGPIDHINRVPYDNRLVNLREATPSQNSVNRDTPRGNTSQFRGVGWHKCKQNWRATIKTLGKSFHIGSFKTEMEAATAYDQCAVEMFGEFAVLNFPLREAA